MLHKHILERRFIRHPKIPMVFGLISALRRCWTRKKMMHFAVVIIVLPLTLEEFVSSILLVKESEMLRKSKTKKLTNWKKKDSRTLPRYSEIWRESTRKKQKVQ